MDHMEKDLTKVTFMFKDGKELVLQGGKLHKWEAICSSHSDYLLPGDETHVLASMAGIPLVRGFVPPAALKRKGGT